MGGFFVLMASSPVIRSSPGSQSVQAAPESGSETDSKVTMREKKLFAVKMGVYVLVLFAVWIGVIICSMILIRRARTELAEEAAANMKAFVEGTLTDHAKRTADKQAALGDESRGKESSDG